MYERTEDMGTDRPLPYSQVVLQVLSRPLFVWETPLVSFSPWKRQKPPEWFQGFCSEGIGGVPLPRSALRPLRFNVLQLLLARCSPLHRVAFPSSVTPATTRSQSPRALSLASKIFNLVLGLVWSFRCAKTQNEPSAQRHLVIHLHVLGTASILFGGRLHLILFVGDFEAFCALRMCTKWHAYAS
ncbi:hypothetical protein FKP32DRAFT_609399 [Trametes sanguinea]|nr:hypothetical protein FKP32DRAFT_609399 [Trametes sanguinea]